MSKKQLTTVLLIVIVAFIAVTGWFLYDKNYTKTENNQSKQKMNMSMSERNSSSNSSMEMMDQESENNVEIVEKNQKEKELAIPPLLKADSETDSAVEYTLTAQEGESSFIDGEKTKTLGYNGNFLGPVLRVKNGQKVTINTENKLTSDTSFHWHGLKIPSDVDGGPHQPVKPNETKKVDFTVEQEAATLWFHPHPDGETAKQVYDGLAGVLLVEDENSDKLDIPKNYGKDDIPVIVQDRVFDNNNQLNYESDRNEDGTQGDTLLVNGTINPYINVSDGNIRLRLLNGSNARNYEFSFDDGSEFKQIASDGGFLANPISLDKVMLTPGERAEIIVNTEKYKKGDVLNLMDGDSKILSLKITKDNLKSVELPTKLNEIANEDTSSLPEQKITLKGMSHMVSIDGKTFDMNRIDLEKKKDEKEIWEIYNAPDMMGGMIHPFHIHGVQFRILSRNGKTPPENEAGWKDTVALNPDETVKLEVQFQNTGIFMYHCHNLEHEENGMMGQVKVTK